IYALRGITLLPARFGAIFSSEAALSSDIRRRKAILNRVLSRIANADEWGVKVYLRRRLPATANATSGRDYLQKKAQAMSAAARAMPDADVEAFAHELGRVARATAPVGKISGAQPDLQWQASFLVPRAGQKSWQAVLRKYAAKWGGDRSIESTGPWPPY